MELIIALAALLLKSEEMESVLLIFVVWFKTFLGWPQLLFSMLMLITVFPSPLEAWGLTVLSKYFCLLLEAF
jgi:hypothetical protein